MVTDQHHHDRRDRLAQGLQIFYKFKGLKQLVIDTIGDCARCDEHVIGVPKTKQAILTSRKLQIVMFDLFKMPMQSTGGEVWVLLVKDHFTKMHWGRAFASKDQGPIAAYIMSLFMEVGTPERLHCDNGGEFLNACMDAALGMLGNPAFSQGRARHPQTQGCIERANGTVKRKLIMACQDQGYVVHGQDIDWVTTALQETIANENDAPIAMYKWWSPFEMFHGRPRMAGFVKPPCPGDLADMYAFMHECQLARAFKRNKFPEMHALPVGTVVNVRATQKEVKDGLAISEWSARAVIHDVHAVSGNIMCVRWLTQGLSANKKRGQRGKEGDNGRQPGDISRYYTRGVFKPVKNAPPAVLHVTADGHVLITEDVANGDCNYVFVDGEWKGALHNCARAQFDSYEQVQYGEFVLGAERYARAQEAQDEGSGGDSSEGGGVDAVAAGRNAFRRRRKVREGGESVDRTPKRTDSRAVMEVEEFLRTYTTPTKSRRNRKKGKRDEEQDCARQPKKTEQTRKKRATREAEEAPKKPEQPKKAGRQQPKKTGTKQKKPRQVSCISGDEEGDGAARKKTEHTKKKRATRESPKKPKQPRKAEQQGRNVEAHGSGATPKKTETKGKKQRQVIRISSDSSDDGDGETPRKAWEREKTTERKVRVFRIKRSGTAPLASVIIMDAKHNETVRLASVIIMDAKRSESALLATIMITDAKRSESARLAIIMITDATRSETVRFVVTCSTT